MDTNSGSSVPPQAEVEERKPPRQLDLAERAIVTDEVLRDAVRHELSTSRASSKIGWERWSKDEMARLVLGFVLTTLVGGLLTYCYQSEAEVVRRVAAVRETRREMQRSTLDTLGAVLNRNYYAFTRFYDAVRKADVWKGTDTVERRLARSEVTRDDYRSRRMTFDATSCALFSPRVDSMFHVVDDAHARASNQLSAFWDAKVDAAVMDEELASTRQHAAWDAINNFGDVASTLLREMAQVVIDTTIAPAGDCTGLSPLAEDIVTEQR